MDPGLCCFGAGASFSSAPAEGKQHNAAPYLFDRFGGLNESIAG